MNIKIVYFVDVISSWCYWAEPAWAELKRRYANAPVEFSWEITLLDDDAMPKSRAQEDWFFRRSGTVVRSPFMLNSGWFEPADREYLAPNCVAEAAKDFGVHDDRVRLAVMEAALREGKKVGDWTVSAAIAAKAGKLEENALLTKARSPEIEKRVRASTAKFHALQVTQRPTFVLESNIADRAVFSGCWRIDPLVATVDAMLADATAYASWKAHMGDPPQS
jgi:predicted DsbA family dithiol-disulfide isomerase